MLTELFDSHPWLIYSLIALFGLIIGSFLNVVIYRLPLSLQREWRRQSQLMLGESVDDPSKKFNIAFPRSHCPRCQHKLSFWENIPLLSYLILRGKCRVCKTNISWRYPLIELATALLLVLILHLYGLTGIGFSLSALVLALLVLTFIDLDHHLLPDQITLPFLWLGLLVNLQWGLIPIEAAIFGTIFGYLILWSIYWLFKLLTKKEGMGYGDFKLLAMLGAWFGWQAIPLIILISAFLGSVIGIAFILFKKHDKNVPIPYGPYLAIAGAVMIFWREDLMRWIGFYGFNLA